MISSDRRPAGRVSTGRCGDRGRDWPHRIDALSFRRIEARERQDSGPEIPRIFERRHWTGARQRLTVLQRLRHNLGCTQPSSSHSPGAYPVLASQSATNFWTKRPSALASEAARERQAQSSRLGNAVESSASRQGTWIRVSSIWTQSSDNNISRRPWPSPTRASNDGPLDRCKTRRHGGDGRTNEMAFKQCTAPAWSEFRPY